MTNELPYTRLEAAFDQLESEMADILGEKESEYGEFELGWGTMNHIKRAGLYLSTIQEDFRDISDEDIERKIVHAANHLTMAIAELEGEVENRTRLVNVKEHGRDGVVMIDRSTPFGNPYRLKKDGGEYTREESIEAYRKWFLEKVYSDSEFREAVESLRGKTLGCFCKPKPCHGDVILEYLNGEYDGMEDIDE